MQLQNVDDTKKVEADFLWDKIWDNCLKIEKPSFSKKKC